VFFVLFVVIYSGFWILNSGFPSFCLLPFSFCLSSLCSLCLCGELLSVHLNFSGFDAHYAEALLGEVDDDIIEKVGSDDFGGVAHGLLVLFKKFE
jgi:hypothetical protein